MTSIQRRKYLAALSGVPASWVVASLSLPSTRMLSEHILLHRLALRRAYRAGYRSPQINSLHSAGAL